MKGLGSRTDLKVDDASSGEVTSEFEDEDMGTGRSTPESEDSTDKVPVKQAPAHRTMINEEVDQPDECALDTKLVPGIVNTQAHFNKLDQQRKQREAEAAQVIQRHYRGHQGRQHFKRQSAKEKLRIEFEYENLNRELKNDTQYNLKTYLAEKKRIREKTGMADSASDSIAEMIGESSSATGNAHARSVRQSGAAVSTQLQNFFKKDNKTAAAAKDPLSLISIFAKRNGVIPDQTQSRSIGGRAQQPGRQDKSASGRTKA